MLHHTIEPLYDEHSRILILGSFPSVKSREQQFFYGHKQNRFWRVLAQVLGCAVPESIEQKKEMLLSHHIAVWDVIASCEITGSSDASIREGISALSEIYVSGKRTGSGCTAFHKSCQCRLLAGAAGGGVAHYSGSAVKESASGDTFL